MRNVLNNIEGTHEIGSGHSTPVDIKNYLGQEAWGSYFKFTVIRNPFDWLLSTYNYIRAYGIHREYAKVIKMDLAQFIEYYATEMMRNEGLEPGTNKCTSLHGFITDEKGEIILDYVGRFEDINLSMHYIFQRIGVPYSDLPFLNVNPYRAEDYRTKYDESSKAMAIKYFKQDMDIFNYNF